VSISKCYHQQWACIPDAAAKSSHLPIGASSTHNYIKQTPNKIERPTCLQCASHPTTLGTANSTGKKSSGNPVITHVNKTYLIQQRSSITHSTIYKPAPKIDVGSQLAANEILVFHRCVVQRHRGFQELVFAGSMPSSDSGHYLTGEWGAYIAKTSSAVFRTMNERGSD
jgi:hypothetical protein